MSLYFKKSFSFDCIFMLLVILFWYWFKGLGLKDYGYFPYGKKEVTSKLVPSSDAPRRI